MTGADVYTIIVQEIRKNKKRFIERLSANLAMQGECRVWVGATNDRGYPRINFWREGKPRAFYVHDIFWTLTNRKPKPKGFDVDHTCNNRRCQVHLDLVVHKENCERREERKKVNGAYNKPC